MKYISLVKHPRAMILLTSLFACYCAFYYTDPVFLFFYLVLMMIATAIHIREKEKLSYLQ